MPLDVKKVGCHFLTGTGRKYLRAPRGSGFLYVSPQILADNRIEPGALDVRGGRWLGKSDYEQHGSARRYEEYEMSFAAKVCLMAAIGRNEVMP
jgi:cysteine desulfurase / selenocysteine lyase